MFGKGESGRKIQGGTQMTFSFPLLHAQFVSPIRSLLILGTSLVLLSFSPKFHNRESEDSLIDAESLLNLTDRVGNDFECEPPFYCIH